MNSYSDTSPTSEAPSAAGGALAGARRRVRRAEAGGRMHGELRRLVLLVLRRARFVCFGPSGTLGPVGVCWCLFGVRVDVIILRIPSSIKVNRLAQTFIWRSGREFYMSCTDFYTIYNISYYLLR